MANGTDLPRPGKRPARVQSVQRVRLEALDSDDPSLQWQSAKPEGTSVSIGTPSGTTLSRGFSGDLENVNVEGLAAAGTRFLVQLALSGLTRIEEILGPARTDPGSVIAALSFQQDGEQRLVVAGRLVTSMELNCSTCLEGVEQRIEK